MDHNKQTDVVSEKATRGPRISRKWRFGTVAMVTTVIVVAVVMLMNVAMDALEARYPLTLDLTSDGRFSLSEESVALARGVQKDVDVIVFVDEAFFTLNDYTAYPTLYQVAQAISKNYGSEFVSALEVTMEQFYNMLKQYMMESNGRVKTTFINLDANPTLAVDYQAYEVETGTILFLCEDRYQKMDLMELLSAESDETTFEVTFTSDAERQIAAKINLVSAQNVKTATILTGHDEDAQAISALTSMLTSNGCMVETLDITTSAEPVEQTDVFVIVGAKKDYSPEEIARLRKWIDNDGRREKDLAIFVEALQSLPNLYEMLHDEYGVEVLDAVIAETDANNVYLSQTYPYGNAVYADVQVTDYTATFNGQRVVLPYAAALQVHLTDSTDAAKYATVLATHGETAKLLVNEAKTEDEKASYVQKDAPSYPIASSVCVTDRLFDNDIDKWCTTNVMVFGSAQMLHSEPINISSAINEDFFLSVFRRATGLESAVSVSTRTLSQKTLDFGGSAVPKVLGIYVFTIGLPLVMIAIAIVVFVRRRRL